MWRFDNFYKVAQSIWLILEAWAVNATAFWTTDFVDEREFKRTITIGCSKQARGVDVIAETDVELLIIEACAYDKRIHQLLVAEFVGNTCPQTKLECLVVTAAVAQQELEGVTYVHLPRWTLEEGHYAWAKAKLLSSHELTTSMEGEFAVQWNVCVFERLVCTIQVAECAAKVKVSVFVKYAEPQYASRKISKKETWIRDYFSRKLFVETAISIMLAWPLEVVAFDATVAQANVGAEHEVVCFFAVSTHFFGIRARKTGLNGCKFRSTGFVAPKGPAHSKIIVATNRQFLIVRSRVRVVSAVFQNGSPLVAIVRYQTVVAVHYASHRRVKVERALVELRKVDVLGLCHCREHHEAQ